MMMPKPNQTFTPEEIANYNKVAAKVNKAWGKQKEKERRDRVCGALNLDQNKSEINSEPSSSGSNASFDKVSPAKM